VGLVVYRLYFHPLSRYPGPKYLAISALPQLYYQNLLGTFYKDIKKLHDQYGNIVRVAPNELSIDGSIGWTDTYGHKKAGQPEFMKDQLFYRPTDDGNGFDGSGVQDIFTSSKIDHRRLRRILAHAFSDAALSEQEDIVQSYIGLLIQRLKENIEAGRPSDMVSYFNWTTFDIIGDLTFGESFHCLETSSMHPWIRIIFPLIKLGCHLRILTVYPFLKPILRLFVTEEKIKKHKESLAFTANRLQKRIALGKDTPRKDFLSYILRHNDEKGMVHQEIMTTSDSLVTAGSETTATFLSGVTYYLSRHPSAWQTLTAEVRTAFKTETDITMRATAALPYLHACLEEGLRIYPSVGLTPPRISPGAMVNGEYIPEGVSFVFPLLMIFF
jgi:cytochrome P450